MIRKSEKYSKFIRLKADVSKNLDNILKKISKESGISLQNLVLYIIIRKYNEIYPLIKAENYSEIKTKLTDARCIFLKNETCAVQPYVHVDINDMLYNLAKEIGYSKKKLVSCIIYDSLDFINLLKGFFCDKKQIQNQIEMKLKILGFEKMDFYRIVSAYALNTEFGVFNDFLNDSIEKYQLGIG